MKRFILTITDETGIIRKFSYGLIKDNNLYSYELKLNNSSILYCVYTEIEYKSFINTLEMLKLNTELICTE